MCVIYDIQNRPFTHFRLILRVLVLLELFPFKMGIRGLFNCLSLFFSNGVIRFVILFSLCVIYDIQNRTIALF